MIRGLGIVVLLFIVLCGVSCSAEKVSASCLKVYNEGGAAAVFGSSECPQWVLSAATPNDKRQNCQFAMLQGQRDYQEDRVACNLDMKIPYLGKEGPEEVILGIAAIFDGHGGKEASDLASKKFLDYFRLNFIFIAHNHSFFLFQDSKEAEQRSSTEVYDKALHDILEEALKKTFEDIDLEFSMDAMKKGYTAGSTGTVALMLNGQLLIGYVGDSRALLCRQNVGRDQVELYDEVLTKDHHPDRDDEKARIKAAGGFVSVWGVSRVNGILAVSRAIGDIYLKRYGVIAVPEIVGWRQLTEEDNHLVIASDGVFERMTSQQVCNIIQEKQASKSWRSCLSSSSSADCVVNTAFRKGSTDNLSAIIIPLRPGSSPQQDLVTEDSAEL